MLPGNFECSYEVECETISWGPERGWLRVRLGLARVWRGLLWPEMCRMRTEARSSRVIARKRGMYSLPGAWLMFSSKRCRVIKKNGWFMVCRHRSSVDRGTRLRSPSVLYTDDGTRTNRHPAGMSTRRQTVFSIVRDRTTRAAALHDAASAFAHFDICTGVIKHSRLVSKLRHILIPSCVRVDSFRTNLDSAQHHLRTCDQQ